MAESVPGLKFDRYFSKEDIHPFDEIEWEKRDAIIKNVDGETVFQQLNVEAPKSWSQLATNIVASKYFRGVPGTPERETSIKSLINRVVDKINLWSNDNHYISDTDTYSHGAFIG